MRITGGMAKGRILKSPRGRDIRPTTDQVREAIFNIIGHDLSGMMVLDLFAGTGSLGIEALSRNASQAVFIDISRQAVKTVHDNLSVLGYGASGIVLRRDLSRGIPIHHEAFQCVFDLVFMDPPYRQGLLPPLLEEIASTDLISTRTLIVTELHKTEKMSKHLGKLQLKDVRIYGDTQINFLNVINDI